MLNAQAVKTEVDAKYPVYAQEALNAGEKKIKNRLMFMRETSLDMYGKSGEEAQCMVRKRMEDDTLDIPEYLLEVQETLGPEEVKRFLQNHRLQR